MVDFHHVCPVRIDLGWTGENWKRFIFLRNTAG